MGTLILGIITIIVTPTATLLGVWLGGRSSLNAQRELMAAQELQGQRDLIVDVVIIARQFMNQQLITLPQILPMNQKELIQWGKSEMGTVQRELRSALDLAIAKAAHSLNDQGLSHMVSELGVGLTLDFKSLKKGPGGTVLANYEDILKWYREAEQLVAELETSSREALRPPDWLAPKSHHARGKR